MGMTYNLFFCVFVWAEQVDGFHVAEVNVVAEQKDKQQFADIFLLLVSIQSLVALTTIKTTLLQQLNSYCQTIKNTCHKFSSLYLYEQESPPDARVALSPRHHSKMAVSCHLGFYGTANSAIRYADPENPNLENMEWIGWTVCEIFAFKLYCDLGTGVRGHSRSSKVA